MSMLMIWFQQAVSFVKSEFSMRFIRLYDSMILTDKLSTFCVIVELMLFTISLVAYVSLTVVLNPLTSATKELSLVDVLDTVDSTDEILPVNPFTLCSSVVCFDATPSNVEVCSPTVLLIPFTVCIRLL